MFTVAKRTRYYSLVVVCSGVVLFGSAIDVKGQSTNSAQGGRPIVTAVAIEEPPILDGDVLADSVWVNASVATGFQQSAPDDGQPATERTEIRVAFTSDTLFIGVVCYDSDPSSIVVSDSRRDSSMNNADSIQIVLDTFHDRQNGFVFGTTPAGQEYDGQVINEGGSRSLFGTGGRGGFSRGGGGGFNLNWDSAWQVRTLVSDIGWSAEFAIPFRTLRFPARTQQLWGVNFQRNLPRRNETAYWAALPRQYNLYRVSMAGQLEGLVTPAGNARNLQLLGWGWGGETEGKFAELIGDGANACIGQANAGVGDGFSTGLIQKLAAKVYRLRKSPK